MHKNIFVGSRRNRIVSALAACVIFFLVAQFVLPSRALNNVSACLIYPIILAAHYCTQPLRSVQESWRTQRTLRAQLAALNDKYEALASAHTRLVATTHFDIASKELRHYNERYQLGNGTMAKILVSHFSTDEQYVLINKGSIDSIEVDMIALYKEQLIGRVIEVFAYHSKVVLITDKRSSIAAYAASSRADGIVQGTNEAGSCTLAFVNHLATIHKGELVLSSGKGLVYPEGFALGTITAYTKNDVCYQIALEPLISLPDLTFCTIIHRKNLNVC